MSPMVQSGSSLVTGPIPYARLQTSPTRVLPAAKEGVNSPTLRFTRDGSAALEGYLAQACARIGRAVQSIIPARRLEGILLGGGYGRGEGGVLRTEAGDQPYNDLEFYVLVRRGTGSSTQTQTALHRLGEGLGAELGIAVEFKVLSLAKLRRSPATMFYYDLISGHRWLLGTDALLGGCERHRDASTIPLSEAARLLLNRCSGLLFSAEQLRRPSFTLEESDFVARNLAKAQLALGDVLLTAFGQYHWSCLERQARLKQLCHTRRLPCCQTALADHADGVSFKLHPIRSTESRERLLERHAQLCARAREIWLWLEARRLGCTFGSTRQYALSTINKCPETHPLKNWLINLRSLGPGAGLDWRGWRYPRERLFAALPLLLFESAPDREALRAVQGALRTRASSFPGLVQAYGRLWARFN